MIPPARRSRLLALVVAPALLSATALTGVVLLVHPEGSGPATRPASAPLAQQPVAGSSGHESSSGSSGASRTSGSSGSSASVPLRVEDPAVTLAGRPVHHHAAPAREPSAKARDADLAAWLREGHVLPRRSPTSSAASAATSLAPGSSSGDIGPGTFPGTPTTSSARTGESTDSSTASFVLSSFNVLGASHTTHGQRGFGSGTARVAGVVALLARHDVDVAGFQELQQVQARELLRRTGGSYALFPGPGKGKDSENSVGWRTGKFDLVQGTTISIPYFNGHHRQMPVVLLRNRATGVKAWFGNFHNPAETAQYHHQQKWRVLATQAEIALVKRIEATGAPLFITGDMNERAAYFCRLTASTDMKAARGGSNGPGGCQAGRPRAVDWIFGTPGVSFSGYEEDRTHLVDITTDHPVVSTRVSVTGSTD